MSLIRTTALIKSLTDLTPTARAICFTPQQPIFYEAGSFVNVFIQKDGETIRRAYSLSNKNNDGTLLEISVRKSINGVMSPLFWDDTMIDTEVTLMGPLGLNTYEKMLQPTLYLFAFGIGAGVVKALLQSAIADPKKQKIVLMTGSRTKDDIVYKEYFNTIAQTYSHVTVEHIISDKTEESTYKKGYIQDHLADYNFDTSDVFVCGQEAACEGLVAKVKEKKPNNCHFFIEGFH